MGEPPLRFRDALKVLGMDETRHQVGSVGQTWEII
jgi:hypothetical protein